MGTCCAAHLAAKVRDYAPNAENGAVTVKVVENPPKGATHQACGFVLGRTERFETGYVLGTQVHCVSPAEFTVSYYPKKE